jgi:aryl-alcohol dehydrogenase-like predicted oxidoreductase
VPVNRRELLGAGVTLTAAAALAGAAGAADSDAAPLIRRRIPSSGEELPIIGLGTSGPFEVDATEARRAPLREVLAAFLASGARLIDTSPMYSTAEGVLGELLSPQMHDSAFLATKVWTSGAAAGIAQMERSAQLLKAPRLDLIQVHNLQDVDTHLKTLRAWKESGRVRYIGVTHYTVGAHAELAQLLTREKLDFVQFNYSPVTRDAEQRLLPLAAERGVAVLINRPFEDGALFRRAANRELPPWAADLGAASFGQLALKFIAAQPAVTCIIPATGKVSHLRDNLGGGRGALPDARQREAIARLFA